MDAEKQMTFEAHAMIVRGAKVAHLIAITAREKAEDNEAAALKALRLAEVEMDAFVDAACEVSE